MEWLFVFGVRQFSRPQGSIQHPTGTYVATGIPPVGAITALTMVSGFRSPFSTATHRPATAGSGVS